MAEGVACGPELGLQVRAPYPGAEGGQPADLIQVVELPETAQIDGEDGGPSGSTVRWPTTLVPPP